MDLTDTHTHLYIEAFDEDREEVIQKAIESGVHRFFLPAIDSTYTERMLHLKKNFPGHIHLMTGLHPTHVKENFQEELDHVAAMLATGQFCAVGEIGIDLYWDKTYFREQRKAFAQQIRWAEAYDLPIVIHCRESFDEIIEVLEEAGGPKLRGIFHCFTGTYEQAQQAISFNMKLGIGGVVTFKNGKIDRFLEQINLEHIVLETDAPYLAPVPFRGKRNESAYLHHILNKLSDIYNMDKKTIAEITTENSKEVFGI